jgi:hypothetical protein
MSSKFLALPYCPIFSPALNNSSVSSNIIQIKTSINPDKNSITEIFKAF